MKFQHFCTSSIDGNSNFTACLTGIRVSNEEIPEISYGLELGSSSFTN